MISDDLRTKYIELQNNNERAKIVDLLTASIKVENFNDEERCWALWNISDNLASMKNSNDELINHKLFEKQILMMDYKYLHWIVSDATQKMTLIIGGYEPYWFDLYRFACQQSIKSVENQRVRFESHRASVAIPLVLNYNYNKDDSLFALNNMKDMLPELKNDFNYKFYELAYFTQYISMYTLLDNISGIVVEESLYSFSDMVKYLSSDTSEHDDNDIYLLGSWQQLNRDRSRYNQAKTGINNYIISLINAGKYKIALDCYRKLQPYNLIFNNYFINKIEYAKSKCNM